MAMAPWECGGWASIRLTAALAVLSMAWSAISRCCDASTRSSDLRDSRLLPALNMVDFALS